MNGKGKLVGLVILALFLLLVFTVTPPAQGTPETGAGAGTASSFIVGLATPDIQVCLERLDQAVRSLLPAGVQWPGPQVLFDQVIRLRLPQSLDAEKLLSLLRAMGQVSYAEVDEARHAFDVPNDPYYGQQWQFGAIQAEGGWSKTRGSTSSTTLQNAVNYAYGKGVVIVAAAGNDGSSSISYPAAYNGVIAVGAINSSNQRADFSNTGASST